MSTLHHTAPLRTSVRRWVVSGFVVGAAMVLPATFFALTSHLGERMHPYLTLGSSLLDPFAGAMAAWSDLLNIVLISVANGIVYAVMAGGLGALVTTLRRR